METSLILFVSHLRKMTKIKYGNFTWEKIGDFKLNGENSIG